MGDTGTGKTTVCQMLALMRGQQLHIINCNQHTETSDFLGGFRPVRYQSALSQLLCALGWKCHLLIVIFVLQSSGLMAYLKHHNKEMLTHVTSGCICSQQFNSHPLKSCLLPCLPLLCPLSAAHAHRDRDRAMYACAVFHVSFYGASSSKRCYRTCRDRDRAIGRFHAALAELQQSELLASCGVTVPTADELAGPELMAVATAATAAVSAAKHHLQAHLNGRSWDGEHLLHVSMASACYVHQHDCDFSVINCLHKCGVRVPTADELARPELMAVATPSTAAVSAAEHRLQSIPR